jgi:NAD(P)-dependent dehydrogenase (short-subunit alcohol dehydrogenase family)
VSLLEDIQRLFAETKKACGRVDILVNNAGIYEFAALEAITPEHIQKQFSLNVPSLILTTQEALKFIGPKGGSIVNIGSIVGPMPAPQASVYSATKAAVDAISVSLSQELSPRRIRVNSLNLAWSRQMAFAHPVCTKAHFGSNRKDKPRLAESLSRTTLLQQWCSLPATMLVGSRAR